VPAFLHRIADLAGVPAASLRDPALISGLLVAGAAAAGLSAGGSPVVRRLAHEGVSAILFTEPDGCHFAAHSFPPQELLLLDLLAPAERDTAKAIDVIVRRFAITRVRMRTEQRGAEG
jgi:S-adenosylmethionine/arginine decarboxylase-like enzyme